MAMVVASFWISLSWLGNRPTWPTHICRHTVAQDLAMWLRIYSPRPIDLCQIADLLVSWTSHRPEMESWKSYDVFKTISMYPSHTPCEADCCHFMPFHHQEPMTSFSQWSSSCPGWTLRFWRWSWGKRLNRSATTGTIIRTGPCCLCRLDPTSHDQPKVGIVGKHDSWITAMSVPDPTNEKKPEDPNLLLPGVLSSLLDSGFLESVPDTYFSGEPFQIANSSKAFCDYFSGIYSERTAAKEANSSQLHWQKVNMYSPCHCCPNVRPSQPACFASNAARQSLRSNEI